MDEKFKEIADQAENYEDRFKQIDANTAAIGEHNERLANIEVRQSLRLGKTTRTGRAHRHVGQQHQELGHPHPDHGKQPGEDQRPS